MSEIVMHLLFISKSSESGLQARSISGDLDEGIYTASNDLSNLCKTLTLVN